MQGEEIYDTIRKIKEKKIESEVKRGLSFGDLRVSFSGDRVLMFETPYEKTKDITIQTLEEIVKEAKPKEGQYQAQWLGGHLIYVLHIRNCAVEPSFLYLSKEGNSPVKFTAHNEKAVQVMIDIAKKLGLDVEAKPHYSYKNEPIKKIVREAFHIKREGMHFFQLTYNPEPVEPDCHVYIACDPEFNYKNADGTMTKIFLVHDEIFRNRRRRARGKLFRFNKKHIKFRGVNRLDLEQIQTREPNSVIYRGCSGSYGKQYSSDIEHYLDCAKSFIAKDQGQDFEYLQGFVSGDQKLPIALDNIRDAHKKLKVIKMLEGVLKKEPGLKDFAEKCGVHA